MHHMIITQTAITPSFAEEDIDYEARFQELITAFPDYQKWFEDQAAIIAFVKELAAYRTGENMLRFVGSIHGEEVAYIGVNGMNMPTPEIQITVKEGYRGRGYGKEMLEKVLAWLFEHTDKESFLYRLISGNVISEKLVMSVGGMLREPNCELERATVKTYKIQRNKKNFQENLEKKSLSQANV